jgi:hypothetical protein
MREWKQLADLLGARDEAALREWFAYRYRVVTCSEEMVLLPGRMNPRGLQD